MLRHVVEAVLTNRAHELKEFTIATQVFGRPDSFDPRIDSLVRVEATRLRNRLQHYYERATEADRVEISLPAGSYVPTFRRRIQEEVATPPSAGTVQPAAQNALPSPTPAVPLSVRHHVLRKLVPGAALVAVLIAIASSRGLVSLRSASGRLTGPLQRLAIPGEVLLSPVITPNSQEIFFASNRGNREFRIWRQTLDGDNAQALTPAESDAFDLDLSRDGKWIAYWSSRNGGGVYRQAATGGPELLVAFQGRSPRFGVSGEDILFWAADQRSGFGRVFLGGVSREGNPREPKQLAQEFDDAHNPQWLPDGRVLVCGTLRSNQKASEHDLWIIDGDRGRASEPVKTWILPYLSDRGIALHGRALETTSFRFRGNTLIFAGVRSGRVGLWSLPFSSDSTKPVGEPLLLHQGESSDDSPSTTGEILAFSSTRSDLGIWSIPIGTGGLASGSPELLTDQSGEEFYPSLSGDGKRLVYVAAGDREDQIWQRELETGRETEILRTPLIRYLLQAPDGRRALYKLNTGVFPQSQEIHAVDLGSSATRKLCADCGGPTSVSPDGKFVIHDTGNQVTRLAVVEPASGQRREVIRHARHAARSARISPDGQWVAFEFDRGLDGKQIVLAPFLGLTEIPESRWTALTGESEASFEPAWSPDGRAVYFLSERTGSRDIWMQRVDRDSGRREGQARLVISFRNPGLTPLRYHVRPARYTGLSVGAGRLVLTLCELSSSIWFGKFQ